MAFFPEKYCEIIDFTRKNQQLHNISIVAVTKTQSQDTIKLAIEAGVKIFGENRVQEALQKYTDLKKHHKDIKLHMIGSLQTNKVKRALEIFDIFHTLDRENLANEFSKHAELSSLKSFLIQVNTGDENQKSGVAIPNTDEFIKYCLNDLKLNIVGLMCLPPINNNPQPHFLKLKNIAQKNNLKHLSMGMSNDYKIAIECGATLIRIGSYFFGIRNQT